MSANAGQRPLRPAIEMFSTDFACAMRNVGATRRSDNLEKSSTHIIETKNIYYEWRLRSKKTSRDDMIQWVTQVQKTSLGSGAMGSDNDLVVTQLFRELSRDWAELAREHIDRLASQCKQQISQNMLARNDAYAEDVADNTEAAWIHPHLDAKLAEVKATIDELEKDTILTPTSYDPRLQTLKDTKIRELCAVEGHNAKQDASSEKTMAVTHLMHAIAFYETALEYWITAIVKQVAERFLRCVPTALSPESVLDLSADEARSVMAESGELAGKRKRATETVETLAFVQTKLEAQIKCLS